MGVLCRFSLLDCFGELFFSDCLGLIWQGLFGLTFYLWLFNVFVFIRYYVVGFRLFLIGGLFSGGWYWCLTDYCWF